VQVTSRRMGRGKRRKAGLSDGGGVYRVYGRGWRRLGVYRVYGRGRLGHRGQGVHGRPRLGLEVGGQINYGVQNFGGVGGVTAILGGGGGRDEGAVQRDLGYAPSTHPQLPVYFE